MDTITRFTPESLLALALVAKDKQEEADALAAAAWMEKTGHAALRFVGSFGAAHTIFRRGVKVRIPKGTALHRPSFPGETHIVAKRTYTVTLHDCYRGYATGESHWMSPRDVGPVVQPQLLWAGTGGYWYNADPNDVEIVD